MQGFCYTSEIKSSTKHTKASYCSTILHIFVDNFWQRHSKCFCAIISLWNFFQYLRNCSINVSSCPASIYFSFSSASCWRVLYSFISLLCLFLWTLAHRVNRISLLGKQRRKKESWIIYNQGHMASLHPHARRGHRKGWIAARTLITSRGHLVF